jgi:hypothetical protein
MAGVPKRYILRVELEGVVPTVWRRLVVEADVSLANLHHIIQAAMGWTDSHLHEFEIHGELFALPHPDDDVGRPVRDERRARLGRLARRGEWFHYNYDFGDDWRHLVTVEGVEAPGAQLLGYAWILEGERACPPEDVGGVPGYERFLETLRMRPRSADAHELREWVGAGFDPKRFDRHAANAALLRMAWNGWGGK